MIVKEEGIPIVGSLQIVDVDDMLDDSPFLQLFFTSNSEGHHANLYADIIMQLSIFFCTRHYICICTVG
jgi:hypothetical protein